MTRDEFKKLLRMDRPQTIQLLMEAKVHEWMNDGEEGVVRCLTQWAINGINLGDDDDLLDLSEGCVYLEE